MKIGNILLSIGGLFMAGIVWMIVDSGRPSTASLAISNGRLGSVLSSSKPVLVEFYADWCGPCKMVGPKVEALAEELKGRAEVVRLNVDENRELAAKYDVHGIPCFIAFKNGSETSRQVGGIPPELMRSMIGM
jgi:thioredoxin 1